MSAPLVLLGGSGRIATAVQHRLRAAGAEVAHLHGGDMAPGDARLARAAVMVLAADDDSGNVDIALQVRRARPDLPLVVRLFDDALANYLRTTLPEVTVLSMSGVAAPMLAEATDRALAARRPRAEARAPRRARARHRWLADRVLLSALVGLALLVVPSTVFFARVLHLRPLDALYFVWTTVMTVGYGDISLRDAPDAAKVVGMALMSAGAAFIAALFALFSGWVVSRRLDVLRGRVRVHARDHIIVAGAGNVGVRVAGLLSERGHHVVVIERNGESRHIENLRAAGHHVIIADATREEVLVLAGVDRAAAVVALTDADALNVQIALHVRSRAVDAPVVLRVVSPELAAHVNQRGDGVALSPLDTGSAAFADAALAAARRSGSA